MIQVRSEGWFLWFDARDELLLLRLLRKLMLVLIERSRNTQQRGTNTILGMWSELESNCFSMLPVFMLS